MSQICETARETDLLAPFEIWEIQLGDRTIKFFEPLLLTPCWLEDDDPTDPDDDEYLCVERSDIDLSSWGRNRKELWNCIRGDIREAWECFVQIPDDRLTKEGKKIKNAYLAIAEEVSDE
jgi:hypothetical protein